MAKFFWNYLNIKSHLHPARLTPIEEALEWQDWFLGLKKDNIEKYNFIMFAEHKPVYIYPQKIAGELNDEEACKKYLKVNLAELPAPLFQSPRNYGGTITFFGPGILVCYLIVDVAEVGCDKLDILGVMRDAVKEILKKSFHIEAYTLSELLDKNDAIAIKKLLDKQDKRGVRAAQGVWVIHDGIPKKIMSDGVAFVGNVSSFGFALNICADLTYFDAIYPCGLDTKITSIEKIAKKRPALPNVARVLAAALVERFKEVSGNNAHKLV